MPHGTPDWGLKGPKSTVYGLDDMAELAVRLGSPVSYDRRGDVMFHEDFSQGLAAWTWNCTGDGCGRALDCMSAVAAPYGIKLTTGPDDGDDSWILHSMYLPQLGLIGLEASCMPTDDMGRFVLDVLFFDGVHSTRFWADYNHATGELEVPNDAFVLQVVATPGVQQVGTNSFFTFKAVMDLATPSWARLLFNDQAYDISAYAPWVVLDPSAARMEFYLVAYTAADVSVSPTIDRVVVTQNEPIGG